MLDHKFFHWTIQTSCHPPFLLIGIVQIFHFHLLWYVSLFFLSSPQTPTVSYKHWLNTADGCLLPDSVVVDWLCLFAVSIIRWKNGGSYSSGAWWIKTTATTTTAAAAATTTTTATKTPGTIENNLNKVVKTRLFNCLSFMARLLFDVIWKWLDDLETMKTKIKAAKVQRQFGLNSNNSYNSNNSRSSHVL